MKRKALIIYCTNTRSGSLNGPIRDNKNIRDYLKSDVGGQWCDSEIISLPNPRKRDIEQVILNEFYGIDYSFVVFTGHGCINSRNGFQYIEVIDGDMSIKKLITKCPRQTIIVDACRGYECINDSISKSFSNLYEYFSGRPNTRKIFDAAVMQAEEGITVLYSADQDQSSLDDPDKGGAYIYSLLSVCKEWEQKQTGTVIYYSIRDAHEDACGYLQENFITNQNPVMNSEKRRRYYPIAVK